MSTLVKKPMEKQVMRCVICLDRLFGLTGEKTRLKVTPCGHVFHAVCFEDAMTHR